MKISKYKCLKYSLLLIPFLLISSIIFYLNNYYKAMPEVKNVLISNDKEEYTSSPWIEFTSKASSVNKGIIIYPGGKVDPNAYAPLAKNLSEAGFKIVIVPMPFNLAMFSPNKAEEVIAKYANIKDWYIAGHSLGGVFASQYAYNNQDKIKGLILLASYPQDKNNLSSSNMKVLSIYGTKDGFVTQNKIDASKKLLPKDTKWLPINGGNHSQMGWYGFQKGDNKADITREDQQKIVESAIIDFVS